MSEQIALVPTLIGLALMAGTAFGADDALLPAAAGIHERTFRTEALTLRWAVDVPAGEAAAPRPLVLALHYGFDSSRGAFPPYYGKGFLERVVAPGWRDLGAFIVAPDSHGHPWPAPEIAQPVLALLDALVADPRIDSQRVVVTGYSMGGTGTWWLAATHGDRFAAAVPMAGRFRSAFADTITGLPIHALHSRDDELIGIQPVRELIAHLAARGEDAQLTELEGIKHFQSPRYAEALREVIVPWLESTLRYERPAVAD